MKIDEKNIVLDASAYDINNSGEDSRRQFKQDVLEGLRASPKRLQSKYFYDKKGDELFQKIMHCQEYYLTRSELEIFKKLTPQIVNELRKASDSSFDLIELGVGDGTKSKHLIKHLLEQHLDFNYFPIDISQNILSVLEENFHRRFPDLNMIALQGEYFDMLNKATHISDNRKVVMFLGGNIGNMSVQDAEQFCRQLRNTLNPGDIVMIGFDLKKHPQIILDAYNDKGGLTRDFNLNLLERINLELEGDFDISQFTHYQTYDPETGACKSFLVSESAQNVTIDESTIQFSEGEAIFMEVSQKYTVNETENLARASGFRPLKKFTDAKGWFIDTLWVAV